MKVIKKKVLRRMKVSTVHGTQSAEEMIRLNGTAVFSARCPESQSHTHKEAACRTVDCRLHDPLNKLRDLLEDNQASRLHESAPCMKR